MLSQNLLKNFRAMYAHQREVIFVKFDPFSGLSSEDDSAIALHKMGTIGGHGVYGQYAQDVFLSERAEGYGLEFSLFTKSKPIGRIVGCLPANLAPKLQTLLVGLTCSPVSSY